MEVTKEAKNNELLIRVSGRLDTTSSPVLEKELSEIEDNITTVILDFAKLEYVSSSGLRIILSLQKQMNKKGKLIIRNVGNMVKEVFDITGFSSILTIE